MTTRIFFVTDVHGSDSCFRKFVNGAKFYKADILILGGDVTGKMIVPITAKGDGTFECNSEGNPMKLRSQKELVGAMASMRNSGYYPYAASSEEIEKLRGDAGLVHELFVKLMNESLLRWLALAQDRLKGTGVSCYVSPGNDDFFEIDDVLKSSSFVIDPEGRVVEIDGQHEMITLGYTNHTPWNSPREVDEDALGRMIEEMAGGVKRMERAIFNIHVPPIGTSIDQAPKLDGNMKPVMSAGSPLMISAGSSAVRMSIERHQPLIGLHGHIHESRGLVKIGRTLCFNPGSEYNSGILRGVLCDLEKDSIKSYLLTSG